MIPTIWCGEDDEIPEKGPDGLTYYNKRGSRFECLKKGVGTGSYLERIKSLPRDSLQRLKYVGETYEKKFSRKGIKSKNDLISKTKSMKSSEIDKLLKYVFTKSNGTLDKRAFNVTVVYLRRNGVKGLRCQRIV